VNNSIIAIGGLLALVGAKSRFGSGVRFEQSIYIGNRIPLVNVNDLIEEREEVLSIIDKFVDYFFSSLSSDKYRFIGESDVSDAEKRFIDDWTKKRFIDDWTNQWKSYPFKIYSQMNDGELLGALIITDNYIDVEYYIYLEDGSPNGSENFHLLRLFTEHVFTEIMKEETLRMDEDYLRTALEKDRSLGERFRDNERDLWEIRSRWNVIAEEIKGYNYLSLQEDVQGFSSDSLYEIKRIVHHAGNPYDIYIQPKSISNLRKR